MFKPTISSPKRPVALVTGGGRGLGLATAQVLADDLQARICLVDLEISGPATELVESTGGLAFPDVDVRDVDAASATVARIEADLGRLDVVVLNAGVARDAMVWKMDPQAFAEVLDVHVAGAFNYARACIPGMRRRGWGRIVAISSVQALRARRGVANYTAAKAAIIGFVRATARDVGRFGITVNAVAPGFVKTDLTASLPAEALERAAAGSCLERLVEPEDVGWAVAYLASPRARNVTGTVIVVDAGATA